MNQILVSEKIYVTPELKKKKRMYKIYFFLVVFLIFILSSYYIYAEYDKSKSEEQSQEILASLNFENNLEDDTTIKFEDNATIVILNEEDTESVVISTTIEDTEIEIASADETEDSETVDVTTYVTSSGQEYYAIATIYIPSIDCNYPILNTWSDELLKISPCYYHGASPNQVGNFCIVGHNYRSNKFFSNVPDLEIGDIIEITDLTETTYQYSVYDIYTVDPEDTSCTSQLTDGKTEITLITCTDDGTQRVVVKATKV